MRNVRVPGRLGVLVVAVGVMLGSALAYAGIPDDEGVIHTCYNAGGILRVVDSAEAECSGGDTPLSWGKTGPAGPPGPSAAVSGSKAGVQLTADPTTIAELTIPEAGSYVVFAKLYVFNVDIHGGGVAACQLSAGSDVDEVEVGTGGDTSDDVPVAAAALNLVHTFGDAGSVELQCSGGAAIAAQAIRITAIKVGTLTDGPLD